MGGGGAGGGGSTTESCTDNEVKPCYTGRKNDDGSPTEGKGICHAGQKTCQNDTHTFGPCVGEVTPTQEQCDTFDNDCNGQTDENCACVPNQTRPCHTVPNDNQNKGICHDGTQTCDCTDPQHCIWPTACPGEVLPAPETCNGADDDCNGQTDENDPGGGGDCNVPGAFGICAAGKQHCDNGAPKCFPISGPQADVCDGVDNNCDGQTDEGDPGGGGACTANANGKCANGTLHCHGGAVLCDPGAPVNEIHCNHIDDNCDGTIDNNDACCFVGSCDLDGTHCKNNPQCAPGGFCTSGSTAPRTLCGI